MPEFSMHLLLKIRNSLEAVFRLQYVPSPSTIEGHSGSKFLRTDTGGLASICVFSNYSGTIVARILYYIPYERYYFSLSNDIVIRKFRLKISKMEISKRFYHYYLLNRNIFYHYYLLNRNISVTIGYINFCHVLLIFPSREECLIFFI